MTEEQIREIQTLVEGLVAGRMLEASKAIIPLRSRAKTSRRIHRDIIKRVSTSAGAYVAGQLREVIHNHNI